MNRGCLSKYFAACKNKQGEKNVGAEHGKTLSDDWSEHLQIQSAETIIPSAACRKVGRERSLYQPNRVFALAQRNNLHGSHENRGSFASAGVRAFGGRVVPKIFAVYRANKFFGRCYVLNYEILSLSLQALRSLLSACRFNC